MNTCMHCGFTGEPEDFKHPTGKVCKKCYRKQDNKRHEKNREKVNKRNRNRYRKNPEHFLKQQKKYYDNNHEHILKRRKEHRKNNHERINEQKRIASRKNGVLPWSKIKHFRLGLYIEQTIAAMFGSVTEPYDTPDIDFICPNGYKMQVKAASIVLFRGNPRWVFHIRKNIIADYFILVAVNKIDDINKEDFKPRHIWMMKGNILNKRHSVSKTPSRVSKWDKYSIMEEYENRFTVCCSMIKRDNEKKCQ